MSFLNEQLPIGGAVLAKFQLGIDEGDEGTDGQIAGTILFKQKLEIEGAGGRPGHDEDEEVTLEVDLAGEVVVRDGFEVAAFLLGEPGGVEGWGVRGHLKSFQIEYRTFVLVYKVLARCQVELTVYKVKIGTP